VRLDFLIAWRYLRSRKEDRFLSIISGFSLIGITLGVAALIIVMAVMHGYRQELLHSILGFNGHINIQAKQLGLSDYQQIVQDIEKASQDIKEIYPVIERQTMIAAGRVASASVTRGMEYKDIQKKEILSKNIIRGDLANLEEGNAIIIGDVLANNMRVDIGDDVKLIAPSGTYTVLGQLPRAKTYKIAAIFKTGMYLYDNSYVFIPLSLAQLQFGLPEQISYLELELNDMSAIDQVRGKLHEIFNNQYIISDWKRDNSQLLQALDIERVVMFLILTLIIIVAAFNIISSMVMLVNNKNKDIAILRTMGASRMMIMRIFIICGSLIGMIGTIIGILLGIGFASNIETIRKFLEKLSGITLFDPLIYYLAQLPSVIVQEDVVRIGVMACILSLLATLYPAWRASRMEPADIIRNE